MKVTRTDEVNDIKLTTVIDGVDVSDLQNVLGMLDGNCDGNMAATDDTDLDVESRLVINLADRHEVDGVKLPEPDQIGGYVIGDSFEVDVPYLLGCKGGFGTVRRSAIWAGVDRSSNSAIIELNGDVIKIRLSKMQSLRAGKVMRVDFG